MTPNARTLYSLIREIRGAFHDLREVSGRMNADVEVSAPLRAVLEHLADHGPQTVPQIAAAKNVTRQHIQTGVDDLVQRGFVRLVDNPAHKRSRLVTLADPGREVFTAIRTREAAILDQLADQFDPARLAVAAETVAKLRKEIDGV